MAALLTDERKHLVPKSAVMMIDAPNTAVVDMQGDFFPPSGLSKGRGDCCVHAQWGGYCTVRSYFIDQKAHF